VDRTEDDLRVLAARFVDHFHGLTDLLEGHPRSTRDVDQYACGAGEGDLVEQGRGDRLHCGPARATLSLRHAFTHHCAAATGHHRSNVGEIHVDLTVGLNQVRDAAGRVEQNLVRLLECLQERRPRRDHGEQALVRYDDERISDLEQLFGPCLSDAIPFPSFEQERSADDGDRERSRLPRQTGDSGRGTGSRTAAEPRGDEDEVGT
jgi:hypothetical protein